MNPTDEQAVSDTGKSLTKYTAQDAHEVGLPSPASLNFMFSVANMLYSSALVTKDMGLSKDQIARLREFGVAGADLEERDRKAVVSNAMGKMLVGRELGIEPIASLQDIDIVKAKVFVRYPQLHRLIEEKGWDVEELQRDHERAAIKLTHATKKPRTFEFTLADAQRAGLTKRGGYNGDSPSQYELRPRVMLWSRVISEAYRATGGKGSVYSQEEKQEIVRGEVREALAEPESRAPEADPYAVVLPEPPAAPAANEAELHKRGTMADPLYAKMQRAAEIPTLEKTPEAPVVAEAPTPQPEPVVAASDAPASTAAPQEPEPPKVREMPKPKVDSRVAPLMAEIEKSLPAKARKKIVEEYLRGYFGVGDVKSVLGDPRMFDALRNLQALATSDSWKTPLAGDPHKLGVDAAAGCAKLFSYMAGWPEDCQDTAFKIALARYPDDPGALAEYLQDPIQAETLGFGDLRAFLWVLERVGPTHATMFRERAADLAEAAVLLERMPDNATMLLAIEALPESEQQPNLLDMLRKGAE